MPTCQIHCQQPSKLCTLDFWAPVRLAGTMFANDHMQRRGVPWRNGKLLLNQRSHFHCAVSPVWWLLLKVILSWVYMQNHITITNIILRCLKPQPTTPLSWMFLFSFIFYLSSMMKLKGYMEFSCISHLVNDQPWACIASARLMNNVTSGPILESPTSTMSAAYFSRTFLEL